MPIYEYRCQECGHQLDALQRVSDAPLTECPDCGKPAMRKLVSAPKFRLKGSGWYETDFKTGNKKNIAGDKDPNKAVKAKDSKQEKKAADKPAKTDSPKAGKSGSTGVGKAD